MYRGSVILSNGLAFSKTPPHLQLGHVPRISRFVINPPASELNSSAVGGRPDSAAVELGKLRAPEIRSPDPFMIYRTGPSQSGDKTL